jgi:hypothetical protein
MPTLWNDADRAALVARVRLVTAEHAARWGQFSAAGMLAHLNDATRMATGDLVVDGKAPSFLRWPPVRYLAIHVLPMPKSAPTAPGLIARSSTAQVADELAVFASLVDDAARRSTLSPSHPAFGAMTREGWGVLMHKHIDHHLRQFGV